MNLRKATFNLPIALIVLFGSCWIPTASANPTATVSVDPQRVLVKHFDGWGTSLCWWANVVGGYSNRQEYVDLAFKELRLNIVRYNIGGGENPRLTNSMQFRARMEGFEPAPGKWDWNADANQRWVLRAAVADGVNHVVAFANAPPYWMTVSGSVTGSTNGADNNLRPDCEAAFADYLATVVSQLTRRDGVTFNTVTPMNEPGANWWQYGGHQEGTHMSTAQQMRMIRRLRPALDQDGVHAGIVASEDNSERETEAAIRAYDPTTLKNVTMIVTHTYHADAAARLRDLAASTGKPLWVSEYGDNDQTGLTLARRIRDDINELHASAWIHWQLVDGGGWGLVRNSLTGRNDRYRLTEKFYMLGQFSRFIRPGCEILGTSNDDSLVAFDPVGHELVIVAVNDAPPARTVTYDLHAFAHTGSQALPHRTSGQESMIALKPLILEKSCFTANLPPQSVTTFEISNVQPGPPHH